MAYYIGIRYGSISVYSSTYMTANSRGTYSINSYFTKLDATWNYNNVLYDVYINNVCIFRLENIL